MIVYILRKQEISYLTTRAKRDKQIELGIVCCLSLMAQNFVFWRFHPLSKVVVKVVKTTIAPPWTSMIRMFRTHVFLESSWSSCLKTSCGKPKTATVAETHRGARRLESDAVDLSTGWFEALVGILCRDAGCTAVSSDGRIVHSEEINLGVHSGIHSIELPVSRCLEKQTNIKIEEGQVLLKLNGC